MELYQNQAWNSSCAVKSSPPGKARLPYVETSFSDSGKLNSGCSVPIKMKNYINLSLCPSGWQTYHLPAQMDWHSKKMKCNVPKQNSNFIVGDELFCAHTRELQPCYSSSEPPSSTFLLPPKAGKGFLFPYQLWTVHGEAFSHPGSKELDNIYKSYPSQALSSTSS